MSVPDTGVFASLALDMAPVCNLACRFCFTNASRSAAGTVLSLEQMKEAIRFASAHGASELVVAGAGEPLLDARFWPSVDHATNLGLHVVLYTNGTLIDEQVAARIAARIRRVLVKRNAMDHVTQDRVAGVPGSSQSMLAGLYALMAAGLRSPRLCAESYVMRSIAPGLVDVLRFCRRNRIAPYFESLYRPESRASSNMDDEALTNDELTQLYLRLATVDRCEFGIDTPVYVGARTYGEKPCRRLQTTISVSQNGEVRLCLDPAKRLGNMLYEPLSAILARERVEALRSRSDLRCSYPTAWCEPRPMPKSFDHREMVSHG